MKKAQKQTPKAARKAARKHEVKATPKVVANPKVVAIDRSAAAKKAWITIRANRAAAAKAA